MASIRTASSCFVVVIYITFKRHNVTGPAIGGGPLDVLQFAAQRYTASRTVNIVDRRTFWITALQLMLIATFPSAVYILYGICGRIPLSL